VITLAEDAAGFEVGTTTTAVVVETEAEIAAEEAALVAALVASLVFARDWDCPAAAPLVAALVAALEALLTEEAALEAALEAMEPEAATQEGLVMSHTCSPELDPIHLCASLSKQTAPEERLHTSLPLPLELIGQTFPATPLAMAQTCVWGS